MLGSTLASWAKAGWFSSLKRGFVHAPVNQEGRLPMVFTPCFRACEFARAAPPTRRIQMRCRKGAGHQRQQVAEI
jgi:hypothetical protein